VLDLGAGEGSFPAPDSRELPNSLEFVVRCDIERPRLCGDRYVIADSAHLPFRDGAFDTVVANHSLEHVADLQATLAEVGRVIQADGVFYASVPDAKSLADRIYRWLGRGGGHVNAFAAEADLRLQVERVTGLPCRSARLLFSSFSFLGPRSRANRWQHKLLLFFGAPHAVVAGLAGLLRWLDVLFRTQFSRYGWEYLFGSYPQPLPSRCWTNVCSSCGKGVPSSELPETPILGGGGRLSPIFRCPGCGSWNLRTPEVQNPCRQASDR
jgi:SAM-dependent methyltransferase